MYTKSAAFYDALYHFKDYARASGQVRDLVRAARPNARTLLDVACGTGRHLEHLAPVFEVAGLDLNPVLLEAARARCPGVPLHCGSMVDFQLGRRFDVITCLFSSIAYVATVANLDRTLAAMAAHLNPGGLLVLEPWFWPEKYWTGTITANFVNEPELKIAWMYTSNPPQGQLATLDIHYLVGRPAGVEHFAERHELGLFEHAEYLGAFRKAGLEVRHDPTGPFNRGLYLGSAP